MSSAKRAVAQPAAIPAQIAARDVLTVVFFYRWLILGIIVGVSIIGLAFGLVMRPVYTADASLLVLYARDYQVPSQNPDTSATLAFEHSQVINVEAQILSSRELHREVVLEDMHDHPDAAEVNRQLALFERHFRITLVETANVIRLSYVGQSPDQATQVLSRLIRLYMQQRIAIFVSGRTDFLSAQRAEAQTQLDRSDAELLAYRSQQGIASIDDQISAAVTLNATVQGQKLALDAAIARDQTSLSDLTAQIATLSPQVALYSENTQAQAVDSMELTMLQLQAKRADLASRYTTDSHFVTQLDRQIEDVKAAIAGQKPRLLGTTRFGRNETYDTLQSRIIGLRADLAGETARQAVLASQLAGSQDHLQSLIAVSGRLNRLQIDHTLLVDRFRGLDRQLDQAKIDSNQDQTNGNTNVRIIQAPYPPTGRSNSPKLLVLASMLVGVIVAGVAVAILSSLRDTFLSPQEAERGLGLPVLSAPLDEPRRQHRRPDGQEQNVPVRRSDLSRMITAIGKRTAVGPKKLLFLSAQRSDGVEQVVRETARDLELRSSQPVLVIVLQQKLDDTYGIPGADGALVWDAAGDGSPIAVPAGTMSRGDTAPADDPADRMFRLHPVRGHDIVVAMPRTGTHLPFGRQPAEFLDGLTGYDYVLIHGPAAGESLMAVEFAALVDATILVVRAEATRRPVIAAIRNQILDVSGTIIGIAMTHRRRYIPAVIYRLL